MRSIYNKMIIARISKLMPTHIKIVDFLMDSLEIEKEAAYRRIRGQVSFSLDEVVKLSLKLRFSLDEIISNFNSEGNLLITSFANLTETTDSVIYRIMDRYNGFLTKASDTDDLEIVVAANRLLFLSYVDKITIFRFLIYKWKRQKNDIPTNSKFSDFTIPDEILDLAKLIAYKHRNFSKITILFDEDVFFSAFKEIQHYYSLKLITKEELLLLKKEFGQLLNDIENISQKGKNIHGAEGSLYLSFLDIDNNQIFIKHKESIVSAFFISPIVPMLVTESNICTLHSEWLDSMKRSSVLITNSNEIIQAEFFAKQYEYLNKLGEVALNISSINKTKYYIKN